MTHPQIAKYQAAALQVLSDKLDIQDAAVVRDALIEFNYKQFLVRLVFDEQDPHFVRLIMPGLYAVAVSDAADIQRLEHCINDLNSKYKLTKIFRVDTLIEERYNPTSACVEFLALRTSDLAAARMGRYLDAMAHAANELRDNLDSKRRAEIEGPVHGERAH
jgi:hypothetical protein